MVQFNKLLISPDYQTLYIDCQIMDMPYFDNVYIDKITIDTNDTYDPIGISDSPIYKKTISGNIKRIQLSININELLIKNMSNTMFFVYITTKGTPSENTPCGFDINNVLGVCADTYQVYQKALQYIKSSYNECAIPRQFIDFILRYKAFQMCLSTRNFPSAIFYWKKLIKSITATSQSICKCNG